MNEHTLGAMELRFAELIWAHAPITSGELVRLCAAAFGWKKSTTYTMLRRLCQRGLFQNDGGTVSACMSEAEFRAMQCERFVSDAFDGRCRSLWRRLPRAGRYAPTRWRSCSG